MAIKTAINYETQRSMHENCQLMVLRPKNSQLGNKQPMILIANFLLGKINGKNLKINFSL